MTTHDAPPPPPHVRDPFAMGAAAWGARPVPNPYAVEGAPVDSSGPLWTEDEQRTESGLILPGKPNPNGMTSEEYLAACVTQMRGELLDTEALDKIPALEPLLGDLLQLNTTARIIGPSGTFKSFILLDMAGHIGTGMKWHGHYVRQGTVIYLVAEGEQGIRKRVRAWEQHYGIRMDNVLFLPRPVQAKSPEWAVFIELARQVEPAFVVIDTQARVSVGVEENSNKEMGEVVDRMDDLRRATGACIGLVHHTGHQGEHGRGASGVKGAMQSEINVVKKGDRISNITLTVKSSKQKDEEEGNDLLFGLKRIALDGEAKPDGRPVTSLVLESLNALPERGPEHGTPEWIVRELDKAQVPYGWGRDRVTARCRELGIQARKGKIEEAIRIRKARGKDLPPDLPPTDAAEPAPAQGAGQEETPDQTCPGQDGGSSGQGAENLPAPSPSLGMGQVGDTAPTCITCGNLLDPEWAAYGHDRHVTC
ncbi:AAA family ATPase [Streptomyces sp. ME01-18h]|uniref:AAA family ATPase n=1 Tax=Streptomyces sp. ME01-18h TaxID=462920 RepID=UPI0029A43EE9|nr:AAA family ATPase [Streptomyces sp. ME01-18h]MDX3400061.1 AAA family ATPase [Streptomyces sp. ME01-18h]